MQGSMMANFNVNGFISAKLQVNFLKTKHFDKKN